LLIAAKSLPLFEKTTCSTPAPPADNRVHSDSALPGWLCAGPARRGIASRSGAAVIDARSRPTAKSIEAIVASTNRPTSGASNLHRRIAPVELDAGVSGGESPLPSHEPLVPLLFPGRPLAAQLRDRLDPPVQALLRQRRQLDL